ncbi:MAG TPA: UDP-N-acetylmuramoyl-L-alanine--D-glutamate ligase [Gaiellales bacterium]|nr:UDP-N-acetylmuramoyl-L-alanine--D-glutamate ligase [Gaiellales bacterium]
MSGERFVVLGLRRSGLAASEAIRRMLPDALVQAADDAPDVDRDRLAAAGVELVGQGDVVTMQGATALVKSPGVPEGHPQVAATRAAGVPVWSEVELAYRLIENPIIGITGTNGKTTTTELVGAMLRAGNIPVEVAGNVGRPLSDLAGRVSPEAWIACELSSFQLEDIDRFRARVGVILQVTPDHLDRHGSFAAYLAAKLRLFENQTAEDTAVLNADDPVLRDAAVPGAGRRVWFSRDQSDRIDWEHSAIRGDHNLENTLAAAAAAEAVGVPREARDRALRAFTPPPHRLQTVATRDGVAFVDDSKATNPEAAIKALTAYEDGVRLILGGSLKGSSFAELATAVAHGPVVSVDVYGEAAGQIAAALADARVPHRTHPHLADAVRAAAAGASPGDVVLLSPACASFDEFRDYAERGDVFAQLAAEVAVGR